MMFFFFCDVIDVCRNNKQERIATLKKNVFLQKAKKRERKRSQKKAKKTGGQKWLLFEKEQNIIFIISDITRQRRS